MHVCINEVYKFCVYSSIVYTFVASIICAFEYLCVCVCACVRACVRVCVFMFCVYAYAWGDEIVLDG